MYNFYKYINLYIIRNFFIYEKGILYKNVYVYLLCIYFIYFTTLTTFVKSKVFVKSMNIKIENIQH
ncbi:hypothetical protein C923_02187 [Plasmodium falciparum UGT5.1]|uniref:Uncharacterized protein n=2 Tax=Plasmodium falciparum TaxID=5833 RepID=W7JDV1_PLAFA|nr:hypothetical protein PFBG_02118 [Plasmodium falciparum 7G8]EWC77112.1 hypothetical protein C923_02187 [Plasmodium falciparum UGT5.1]